MRAIGSSIPRVDAIEKVTGLALYPGDIDLPGQAWLKIVFAGQPHARIEKMDIKQALAAPGVIDIITAADVPVNEYGLVNPDQPVLCGLGSTPQAQIVRWEADQVALVVAETEDQANTAAALIQIDYEPLPIVTDPLAAMQADSPKIDLDQESNVLETCHLHRGDIETGFTLADVIVESTYHTHAQEHAYLQPEAGLAFIHNEGENAGRIEVICAGQWMHEDREQVAHALGLPENQVIIRYPAIGGAFGGREDISIQISLALAAMKTGRPVKTVWSRDESIIGHHKRHPYILKCKWGATQDGKIVAAQMDVTSDAGGYAYTSAKVQGNAVMACLGPYEIPHLQVEARTVLTNNCPSGAFRGFGGPQGHFAAENQMNKLASALNMDPVELRMRNIWREGSILPTQSVVPPGCSMEEVLIEAAQRGGWSIAEDHQWQRTTEVTQLEIDATEEEAEEEAEEKLLIPSLNASTTRIATGTGIAASFKNVGYSFGFPESSAAWVELQGEGEITQATVGCVGADVGQGAHMAFRQIAAEVLNIDPERVELRSDNTDITGSSGSASASRLTFMAGNAIKGAAEQALQEWQNEERPARADFVYYPRATSDYAPDTGACDPNITHGYCAQVAQVAVDLDTGHVTVKRLVSVNDVGKAVNPQLVEGQIEGAVAQSVGWTLLENLIQVDGHIRTPHLSNYLIPGILDVVEEIEPVILEIPDPQGPLGVRGMAEMPFIPTAPAIVAAIHDATGVWVDQLPITPEQMWRALQV